MASRPALPLALALGLSALVGCARAPEPPSPPRPPPAPRGVAGAVVVDLKDGTTKAEFDAWEAAWGVDVEFNSEQGQASGVTLAVGVDDVDAALARIREHPEVEAAEPLYIYGVPEGVALDAPLPAPAPDAKDVKGFVPNDPHFARQWNLRMIHMPEAWAQSRGRGVVVAVLDTGVAYEDHGEFRRVPDLAGVKLAAGYDFVNDDTHANDDHGHGTHVAGTVVQATNNGEGVAGVAFEATLMPVKVLDHFGSGTSADIADGIRFAADRGARVINLSLGGGAESQVMRKAVEYARKKGAVVVAAAGNAARGTVEYPAAYPGAVAVSALAPDGRLAFYSSFGAEVDLAAPGGDKRGGDAGGVLQNTLDPRDPTRSVYAAYQGTSMATPHVSGVAALLFAAGARTPDEVERALYAGAAKAPSAAREQYGHGVLDASGALAALGGTSSWGPLAWAAGLLALVLLTLGKRERPGYLNVLVRPSFLLPLLLATMGAFFLPRFFDGGSGAASDVVAAVRLPIPDWQRIIFGRGKLANPLFYSALIPVVLSLVAIRLRGWRPVVGGLALGFAGFLAYAAAFRAPGLAYLPFSFLALPWLAVNALVCAFVARAMLRKEDA